MNRSTAGGDQDRTAISVLAAEVARLAYQGQMESPILDPLSVEAFILGAHNLRLMDPSDHDQALVGTSTLLEDFHAAVVASASFASANGNRCDTISANGNRSRLSRRKPIAAFRCRGSLDQEPITVSCLRVTTCGFHDTGPASQ